MTDPLRQAITALKLWGAIDSPDGDGAVGYITLGTDAINSLVTLLDRAMVEARIDELRFWQWKTDSHVELSGKEVAARIASLKAGTPGQEGADG